MMKITSRISTSLTFVQKQNFSNMLFNSSANPIKERVMSTPTWPVPYYQRMDKAYPVRGTTINNQCRTKNRQFIINGLWCRWYELVRRKRNSQINFKRKTNRWIYIKKHSNQQYFFIYSAYLIKKNDCETMVKAYVDDAGQFLDIANRENIRILGGKTLIWFKSL